MKKITFLLALLIISFGYSQELPIDFEESNDSNIIASVSDGGTFNIIADADNAGESVGEFSGKAGGALYDHIYVPLTTSLDIAATNTISFRVKQTSTEGTTSHLFKLQAGSGGSGSNKEIAFITEYNVWKEVSLSYSGTGTYNELIIFFDFNSATTSGTYLIDDIVASDGATVSYDLPFDFETSPVTSDWEGFEGAGITVEAVVAPQTTGNTSTNLAKIVRNGGQAYAGVVTTVSTALDFSSKSTITARLWTSAPIGTKIMFKTEEAGNAGNNSGEKDVFTTKTGEWEDLVFDFSGVGNTAHTKLVIIPDNGNVGDGSDASTFYFDDIIQVSPTVSYDLPFDFETSPVTSDWEGFEGAGITVEAVVAPQTTGNTSTNLAKIVRNGGQAYAGVVTTVSTALDFSSKSTITARLWTSAPIGTKIMFKTEEAGNAGNNSGEKDVFTTKTGEWEDLVFDFSGVGNASQTRIVIIPDNGNVGDGSDASTFYFDDIIQVSPTVSYDLPFDFETSPVTSDWEGFEGAGITVEAVVAPQTTGNTSTNLAKIVRNGGQAYAGVVTTVSTALDFSSKSTITARLWTSAPIGTKIMFKTEEAGNAGNNSGEKDVFTTKTGEWEDLVFDFSGVGNTAHTKLVIIPDNGNVGDGSDASTFYFDDIIQVSPTVSYDLPFDFETSPVTSDWEGFEGAGITVEAVVAPQTTGNTSTNLAKIVRNGGQAYAGVVTTVSTALDFSSKSTITARLWTSAPIGTKIMFKTEEAGNAGNNSGEKDVFTTKTGEWEDLVFDFSGVGNTAHTKLVIIPDNGNVGDGSDASTFYFDDIIQVSPTVSYDLPFDFETSPVTSDWEGFEGAGITVEAVVAPQTTGNTSTNLAKIVRNGGQAYAGVVTTVSTALDFSSKSTITARLWTSAPIGTKIMFKTEEAGNAGNNSGEKDVFTTKTGEWEDLVFDFSGVGNASQTRIVIIPDNGNVGDGSDASTFYFDDIIQVSPTVSYDLPFDFETSPVTSDWEGFEGAGITVEAVVAPQTTGNTSTNLAKIVRNGGQAYAGVVTTVSTALDFSSKSTITARLWTSAPIGTKIMFKTEEAGNAGNNSGEKDVFTTKTGEWEDLVFDFAGVGNTAHTKLVIIPDNGNVGDGSDASTFYFDDIIQTTTAGTENYNVIDVSIYPNPTSSLWNFTTGNSIITLVEVFNLLGKRVVSQKNNSINIAISAQGLTSGIYIARITTEKGNKSMKLIKE